MTAPWTFVPRAGAGYSRHACHDTGCMAEALFLLVPALAAPLLIGWAKCQARNRTDGVQLFKEDETRLVECDGRRRSH
ncbi:hypothetical protein J3F83DRAFT_734238 [Trichoderma novae-zelandiae]